MTLMQLIGTLIAAAMRETQSATVLTSKEAWNVRNPNAMDGTVGAQRMTPA